MHAIKGNISLNINEHVYLKKPDSSVLGKKIIEGSINLIEEIGFENFTFKKLATKISSTEASIYRYFESKHNLLVYLTIWYYKWLQYRLAFKLANIDCPKDRLIRAIKLLTESVVEDTDFSYINEVKLNKIVIAESSKIYLNKSVDADNSEGFFKPYKDLVQKVSDIIIEINPNYKYPNMLVSTIIEGTHHQRFFAEHLPRLTNVVEGEDSVTTFYQDLIMKALGIEKQ
jgi:AcrR family transcriptional regulator